MDLLQLQYFCTIAQYENITKAAKALFVSQPNLSTSLSRLEEDLGVKLFDRRRGKVSLTPSGQLFLGYVERAINELNAGVNMVRAETEAQVDRLRVVSPQTDFINEVLNHYEPDRHVRIKQITCSNMDVYDRVMSDDADFGFYFGHPKGHILEYIPMLTSERIAIVHESHPFAQRKTISVVELAQEKLICNYCRDDPQFLEELGKHYDFRPQIPYECDDTQIEAALVASGRGITITPLPNYYKFKRADPEMPIRVVRVMEGLPLSEMGVVRRPGVRLTDSALYFLERTADFFRKDREEAIHYVDDESYRVNWKIGDVLVPHLHTGGKPGNQLR